MISRTSCWAAAATAAFLCGINVFLLHDPTMAQAWIVGVWVFIVLAMDVEKPR